MQLKESHIIIGIIFLAALSFGIIYVLFTLNAGSKTLGATTVKGYYEISIED